MTFRLFALAIVLSSGTALAAEDPVTLDKMVQMNRQALDQLRTGQKEAARDGLLEAITVGKRAGLGSHQMMARTYLHLGAVYMTGFGDRDKALKQFENAVKIRPSIQLTPAILTPSVQEVFEAARTHSGVGAPEAAAPPAEAKAESKAEAKAEAKPEPKVAEETSEREPRAAESGHGRLGRARGTKSRPLTHVAERPAPKTAEPEPSVDAAVAAALEEPEEATGRDRKHPFWFSLGLGSGVGFHFARDVETRPDYQVPTGFSAAALAHVSPEIGYRLNERFAVSLQSRHQLVPRSGNPPMGDTDTRAKFAHAVFAKAHYLLGDYSQHKVELWGTATLGGGSAIRLYVPVGSGSKSDPSSSDTVAAGPVALGPGVSVIYHATRRVGLVGELKMLATLGGFALVADLNLGASCTF
jgi:Tfp pilus assembly protein PilF